MYVVATMEIWYFLDKTQSRVDLGIAAWVMGLLTGSLEAIYFIIKRLKNSFKKPACEDFNQK